MLKISRNDLCLCGSGIKHKKCCFLNHKKNKEIERALKISTTISEAKKVFSMPILSYRVKVELVDHPIYELAHEVSKIFLVSGNENLYQLHMKIQRAFNWDNDHMFSFYILNQKKEQELEYSAAPDGEHYVSKWRDTQSASKTEIRDLEFYEGLKFQYLFDYGDSLIHEVSVLNIEGESGLNIIPFKLLESKGECVNQYGSY
jgi:hypothetical protein